MSDILRYVACVIAVILGAVLFGIFTVLLVSYLVRRKRGRQSFGSRQRLQSQYSYISPLDHPHFVIPPYATEEDAFESGSESSLSIIHEDAEESTSKEMCESPLSRQKTLGTQSITRPQFQRSLSDLESRYNKERIRPKYRRTLSSLGGSPGLHHSRKADRKSSVIPQGKIQASIHYATNRSLLVVQVGTDIIGKVFFYQPVGEPESTIIIK